MKFEIVPAAEVALAQQAQLANAAFADYIGGWHPLDAVALAEFLARQGADLFLSRLVRAHGELLGLCYLNRTGRILRCGGMALVPAARGSGAGDALFAAVLSDAQTAGDEALLLEVIEQNPRAHAFYRRHGFRNLGRLGGWRRAAGPVEAPAEITEISVAKALSVYDPREYPEAPWPISRGAIAKVAGTRAFQADGGVVILSKPEIHPVRVHGLFARGARIGLRTLLAGALARFPEREFFVPPVWPEGDGATIFEPLGFVREPLSQFFLRRDL